MKKLFSDIYGQKNAVKLLTSQIKNNHLAHAYLFLGSAGVGKEYLAREFARYLLCGSGEEDDCRNCQLFDMKNHPDFMKLDGAEGIKINELREVIERLNYSPNISKRKVALFANTENISQEVANAMLKTLEEPPLDSVIILTAVSTKSLPETVLSRAQKIKLLPLGAEDIAKVLAPEVSEDKLTEVLFLAGENLGEAKKILSDPAYKAQKERLYADVRTILFGKSIIEKFTILERLDKEDELPNLFGTLFYLVAESLDESKHPKKNLVTDLEQSLSLPIRAQMARKMLKIYDILQYNVNLKLLLEQLILENLING